MRKICVITGTRAEYGLFYPIMRKINLTENLKLQLIATTMHMSKEHAETYKDIEKDGFKIDAKIHNLESGDSNTQSYARLMMDLPKHLENLNPDIVLLLGDRFETHAAATTCLLMNIPIAHIHGGEITEGAVDEQLRHAISKMSHLHFTSTEESRIRLIQMGEKPQNIMVSGAPGIDNIMSIKLKPKLKLEEELSWKFREKSALFTYHPETLSKTSVKKQIDSILKALEKSELNILFTGANADTGGDIINKQIIKFVCKDKIKYKMVHNLGMLNYYSAMNNVDMLIGNSSSGIIEAASFNKPVIDIGHRQKGRLTSGNILHCDINTIEESIESTSKNYMNMNKPITNIYGSGNSANKIVNTLYKCCLNTSKQFHNINWSQILK